jgi:hypothetical protein
MEETGSSEGDIFIWEGDEMVWWWLKARQHNNQLSDQIEKEPNEF